MSAIDRRNVVAGGVIAFAISGAKAQPRAIDIERYEAVGRPRGTLILLYGSDGLTNAGRYQLAARTLAGAGYTVLMPDYFKATGDTRARYGDIRVKFPGWLQAVVRVLDDAGTPRVGVVGFSLGGALALALGAQDRRVAAIVDFFGFRPEGLEESPRLAPTLILHGANDRVVPVSNASAIEALLKSRGTPVESMIYPGEGHGLSASALPDAIARTQAFLSRHL